MRCETRHLFPDWMPAALMLGAVALAMLAANSSLEPTYAWVHHVPMGLHVGPLAVSKPIIQWINEGLMTLFFLLVGIEIRREIGSGHLATPRKIVLPALAALGGMIVPAAIFVAFNWGDTEMLRGWAVPTATDIVLALSLISMLGPRVSRSLYVFLAAVAIFDDIGAIAIIAVFYSGALSPISLVLAAIVFAALVALNRAGVRRLVPYALLGTILWVSVLESGVHATLAGVVLAFALPAPDGSRGEPCPLKRVESLLRPWVERLVVPLFAFFNAGIPLDGLSLSVLAEPVVLGIVVGLFFGKQVGIFAITWLAVRTGLGAPPDGARWRDVYGIAVLAGVGFTMSLFISDLAFGAPTATEAKAGILAGSLLSAIVGLFAVSAFSRGRRQRLTISSDQAFHASHATLPASVADPAEYGKGD